ncbi:MAG: DNA-3-methyladenine glycosylase family protein [Halanaeroarchaeum sp.]
METGSIPLAEIPGPVDLQATIESGQTFRWVRPDGRMYEEDVPTGGDAWYRTVLDGQAVELRQTETAIEWRARGDPTTAITRRLALDEEMTAMLEALPDDETVAAAWRAFPGLRVVDEPFFQTLVSFILSAQMRVERIHTLVRSLADRYGETHQLDGGESIAAFPTPSTLAAVPETELRDLGLGYRAPYVKSTAEMVDGEILGADDIAGKPYEAARARTTEFVGVGEKVADCVLLFSLGYTEPVPLDTWIETALEEHFPEVPRGTYAETSRAIRERFGPYPGVTQTYVFHYLRHREAIEAAT